MDNGISLCMIVKDEEKILEDCLNSIKNFVDEIIIVIDNRSTDGSKEIAKKFTDKVFGFEWVDDFSAARNFSLSFATKEWILILDADEKISREDKIKMRNLINRNESDSYLFNWRDYTNDPRAEGWISTKNDNYDESKIALGYYVDKILRFFKNKKEYFFEGRIHETPHASIVRNNGKVFDTNIIIHHSGNLNKEKFLDKKKFYSKLLKKRLEEKDFKEKTEDYICYELAKELTNLKEYSEAENYLKRSIELNPSLDYMRALASLYLIEEDLAGSEKILREIVELEPRNPHVHHNLGAIYAKKQEYNKAIRKFEKAIELNPNFANAYFNLGKVYNLKGKFNKAQAFFQKAIDLNPEYKNRLN